MISAGIPYTLLKGQEENDVPTFWLLLYTLQSASVGPLKDSPKQPLQEL